jgi:hypothetical protein
MTKSLGTAAAALLLASAAASATPTLQFDVNGFGAQAVNAGGGNTPFGGLSHTGAVQFSVGSGTLNGVYIQSVASGPFINAGLSGVTMTAFSGQVNLVSGLVTGGSVTIQISNGDSYTCQIAPGSGAVSNYVGGGFKIEALTRAGQFNDAMFGNVDVSPWYNVQSGVPGLLGSFLEFNFSPNAQGAAFSDMDVFVDVVPMPPAAWAGMATLAGVMAVRRLRRS